MDLINRTHPELRDVLLQLPKFYLPEDLELARRNQPPASRKSEHVSIHEQKIKGKDDNEITVRIYEPKSDDIAERPALLWIHGGGYVIGNPRDDDNLCQEIARRLAASSSRRIIVWLLSILIQPGWKIAIPLCSGLNNQLHLIRWICRG